MKNKIIHAVFAFALFAIPLVTVIPGSWKELTVGAILNAIYLYISQRVTPTAPIN